MGQDTLWQAVLGEIELTTSRGNYLTWFKHTQLLKDQDDLLVIGVPNVFVKNQLEKKFNQMIIEILQKNGRSPLRIEFKIHAGLVQPKKKDSEDMLFSPNQNGQQLDMTTTRPSNSNSGVAHSYRQGLNERYTFDNFIVGSGNELAYAACQAIAQNPGSKYNPLFLYGGVGIGKTHLIQAAGNEILKIKPGSRIVYISSEQFVQEFLDAIRFKKISDFAGHYRNADALIVDDVQFIAGKEKTQDEFFHTFNVLHQANKQIIISSDKPPKDIPGLEERLRSRFAWGMSIDMQTPDFETRCAIVQNKASQHSINLPQSVVEFLATRVQNNIRELEGALNQVLAYCEMRKVEPDLAMATAIFGNGKARPKHITARQIVERTAKQFHVGLDEILGPKRDKDIVLPRQVAMYMLRAELHMSFPKIAHELGRKDHTTAIHSIDKIERESALSGELKQQIEDIRERIYA